MIIPLNFTLPAGGMARLKAIGEGGGEPTQALRNLMAGHTPKPVAGVAPVFAYLLGEAPLDGIWFDDSWRPFGEPNAFWWRQQLRAALSLPTARGVLDAATVEACAKVAESLATEAGATLVSLQDGPAKTAVIGNVAAALYIAANIRSLKGVTT